MLVSRVRKLMAKTSPTAEPHTNRARLGLTALEARETPAVYTVANTAASGVGSLRQAIADANARAGADTIQFQIPGAGVHTINLTGAALPPITDPVAIDGASEPGYAGTPLIELSGGGLDINTSNCRVTGLIINGSAGYGISISGPGKDVIQGNWIGTDATGTLAKGNLAGGIHIAAGANDCVVGTNGDGVNDTAEGNVIAANGFFNRRFPTGGVFIDGAHRTVVAGNLIGTDVTGTKMLYNLAYGILVTNGGQQNRIGTNANGVSDALERNVINGYMASVYLSDFGTSNNVVAGNYINVDATGSKAMSTGGSGVVLAVGADGNRIGTAGGANAAAERNVISGNAAGQGVDVYSDSNRVAGNYIGTDASGGVGLGNYIGVQDTGNNNTIGGPRAAFRNVIAASAWAGVSVQYGNTTIQGNYIGLDATGTVALGNNYGIEAAYASNLTIGGTAPGARNVISASVNDGISLSYLYGPATIQGNYIGTDATGTLARGNGTPGAFPSGRGIDVWASNDVTIGGSTAGARNVISGNVLDGIAVESGAAGTVVTGNYVGTDGTGKAALGNGGAGVLLTGLIANTTIGGTTAGLRNVISANGVGVHVADGATGTVIQGNYVGTDGTGKVALGNIAQGVLIDGASTGNVVGTVAAGGGNVIAFNGGAGVAVGDAASASNTIRGNSIFANGGLGIDLLNDGLATPSGLTLSRVVFGATTRVIGTVTGAAANSTVTIDLYASPATDPAGSVQGKRYLGSITVITDASGNATFDVILAVTTRLNEWLTATLTDAVGTTSEFSQPVRAGR